jgi:hypothetical protein
MRSFLKEGTSENADILPRNYNHTMLTAYHAGNAVHSATGPCWGKRQTGYGPVPLS